MPLTSAASAGAFPRLRRGVRTFVSTQPGPAGRSMMRVVSLLLRPLNDVLMMAPHSELEVPHSEVIAKAAAAAAKREEAEKRALAAGMSLKDMPKNILAEEEEEQVKLDPAAQAAVNAQNSAMVCAAPGCCVVALWMRVPGVVCQLRVQRSECLPSPTLRSWARLHGWRAATVTT